MAPGLIGTPRPGDSEIALATARAYEDDLLNGKFQDAWNMLTPEYQAGMISFSDWESSEAAVVRSSHYYTLGEPSHDWASYNPDLPSAYHGDFSRAFLVHEQWGDVPAPGTYALMIVFPNDQGRWVISFDPLVMASASGSTETASDGTFSVTVSVPATTHHASDALDVSATLTYLGPQPSIGVDGDSVGLVFFTFTQLDGTRSMVPASILMCAAPTTLQRQAAVTFLPVKSIGWTAEDPNAAFYRQWASDPQVHLPAGRWQILATALIYVGTACYGGTPDHKIVTPPLVLDVTP